MKSKLPVVVAVIVAILAVVVVKMYVKKVASETERKFEGRKYVAAKVFIPAGGELEAANITALEIPDRFVPAQAIPGTVDNAQLLIGQKVRLPIKAGLPILWSDLATERRGGFESVIPQNERAFTIQLAGGIRGGLVQPSDHVDILASFAIPETKKEQADKNAAAAVTWRSRSDMVNMVLLQNVTVLAVGENFTGNTAESAGEMNEMTLAVTLPEAQLLMFAGEHGDLAGVLRKHDDVMTMKREEVPPITFQELEKLIGNMDSLRARRTVEVMKSGKTEEISIETGKTTCRE